MYTEIEQQTLDIDWFFTDNEDIAFVASAGGKLPETIAKLDKDNGLSKYFRDLSEVSEVIINPSLEFIIQKVDDNYLSDFLSMAKKGLYTFDKTILNNFSDTSYHLVASPKTPLKMKDLPENILKLLIKTQYNNDIR
ncbi:hypothetical protein, partial [Chryseobacterium sp. Alg-005]|uniref:hypothetical protein n=1 Tax=Chryseobacterium sp. Alg-005 TaxID=3159516 RepID=UPI0036F2431E